MRNNPLPGKRSGRNPFLRLSIRQRLPLLICTLLLCIVVIFGVIAYLGVRKAALKIGEDRLQTLTQQLSTMLSGNAHTLIASSFTIANKPSVKSFVSSNGKDSVIETKKLMQELQKDSSYVQVEIRDVNQN